MTSSSSSCASPSLHPSPGSSEVSSIAPPQRIHSIISSMLSASLDEEDARIKKLYFLAGLSTETAGEGMLLRWENFEGALVEILSSYLDERSHSPMQFLCRVFNRGTAKISELRQLGLLADFEADIRNAQECAARYLKLCIESTDFFPCNIGLTVAEQIDRLLRDQTEMGLYTPILDAMCKSLDVDEETLFFEGFRTVVDSLVSDSRTCDPLDLEQFEILSQAMTRLVSCKPISMMIVHHPLWCNSFVGTGHELEHLSILGAFFGFSVWRNLEKVHKLFFPNPISIREAERESKISALWDRTKRIGRSLTELTKKLLMGDTRPYMLEWLGQAMDRNRFRATIQFIRGGDPGHTVSSPGFLLNIHTVLLNLVSPLLNPGLKKLNTLQPEYTLFNKRFQIRDETRMALTTEEVQKLAESVDEDSVSNFNSEIFFLSAQCLHLGLAREFERYELLIGALRAASQEYSLLQTTPQGAEAEEKLSNILGLKALLDSQMFAEDFVQENLQYAEGCCRFLLCHGLDVTEDMLPNVELMSVRGAQSHIPSLPEVVPTKFAMLPEFMAEDLGSLLVHFGRMDGGRGRLLRVNNTKWCLCLLAYFLGSNKFVKNPFIRSNFVEIMDGMLSRNEYSIQQIFESHAILCSCLIPGVLSLYVEFERTGTHNQFYDKFGPRYRMNMLLGRLRKFPAYQDSIRSMARDGLVERFLNVTMNDCILTLMEEGIAKLEKIHDFEELKKNEETFSSLPLEERVSLEREYDENKKQATSWLSLGSSSLGLLSFVSELIPEAFTTLAMRDRVSSMLNYLLDYFATKKRMSIRVDNPSQYNFNIRELLVDTLKIFAHLTTAPDADEFFKAVVSDSRSYRLALFQNGLTILTKENLGSESLRFALEKVIHSLRAAELIVQEEQVDYDDAPEEFLDALTFEVMKEPVQLPCGQVVDRLTIQRHLLNDARNPFTNQPLTMEEVVPQPELQSRIEAYKVSKRHHPGNASSSDMGSPSSTQD